MDDGEVFWIMIICSVLAVAGMFTGQHLADNGGNALIEKCQESLPRNQVCILQAVPAEVKP